MKIQMTAKKALRYAGKAISSGEGFSVKSKSDAKLLQAIGRAMPADVSKPAPISAPEPVAEKQKRTYKRKDMVAEPPQAVEVVVMVAETPVEPAADDQAESGD
jgi:hypothetical protein